MEPQIVSRPAFTLMGLKHHVRPFDPGIMQLWQQIGMRMGEIQPFVTGAASYGVSDNMDTATGEFDYTAAFEVRPDAPVPAGMVRLEIPPQTYAVFPCAMDQIQETYTQIYASLPQTGYTRASGPEFEYYDEHFEPNNPKAVYQVYVPVVANN